MRWIWACWAGAVLSAACGGVVDPDRGSDASSSAGDGAVGSAAGGDAGAGPHDDADSAATTACAKACIAPTGGGGVSCPVLLEYSCLEPTCGEAASSDICDDGAGLTPDVVRCVARAFGACGNDACHDDDTCLTFVACIEACP